MNASPSPVGGEVTRSNPFETLPSEIIRKIAAAVDRVEYNPHRWASHALVSRAFRDAFRDAGIDRNRLHFACALRSAARRGPASINRFRAAAWAQHTAAEASALDLDEIKNTDLDCLPDFPKLRCLRLRNEDSSPTALQGLRHFSGITSLNLRWTTFADSQMAYVARLQDLRYLDVSRTNLDNAGAAALAHLPALESMRIELRGHLDAAGLQEFARTTTLSCLYLGSDDAAEADIDALGEIASLRALNLQSFHTCRWPSFSKLKSLQKLSLEWCEEPDDLNFLAALPQLQSLQIGHAPRPKDYIRPLRGATQLTYLHMPPGRLMTDSLAALREMPHLQHVSLPGAHLGTANMRHLGRLPALRSLGLIGGSIDHDAVSGLANLQGLTALWLCSVHVGDTGVDPIAHLTALRHLNISECRISNAGLRELVTLTRLEALSDWGRRGLEGKASRAFLEEAIPTLRA